VIEVIEAIARTRLLARSTPTEALFEIYDNADAFKAHLETPHFKKYAETTKDMSSPASESIMSRLRSMLRASDLNPSERR